VSDVAGSNMGETQGKDGKTALTAYEGNASVTADMKLKITYTNNTSSYDMKDFAVSLQGLPADMDVDSETTCGYGITPHDLIKDGGNCKFVLKLNRTNLADGAETAANMSLNFKIPKASWTTTFGNYTSTRNDDVFVNYRQPMIVPTQLQSSVDDTTTATFTVVNSQYQDATHGLHFTIDGLTDYLDDQPTATGGCTINPTDYSTTCDLSNGNPATITYTFFNYLGLNYSIPLLMTSTVDYFALPDYYEVNYVSR
jgi:hypothetical protein